MLLGTELTRHCRLHSDSKCELKILLAAQFMRPLESALQSDCLPVLAASFTEDSTSDEGSVAEGYEPVRLLRFASLQRQQPPRQDLESKFGA